MEFNYRSCYTATVSIAEKKKERRKERKKTLAEGTKLIHVESFRCT
jgi:hypothetical protein